ncbi:MAG: RluA family pseudouridine synthase [Lachnospiraceae bacterium]|nr:RluA family pseudouridine synthase [Lachnospiraceae bacterium]
MNIQYEDEDLIVVYKPAGLATQTGRIGQADMVSELKNYIAKSKPGKAPYLAMIHRLDQPVEGLLVFGKTPQAAKELNYQLQTRGLGKHYYAVITQVINNTGETEVLHRGKKGDLLNYLVKDAKTNSSFVVSGKQENPNAKEAKLHYEIIQEHALEDGTKIYLADVTIETGRHHQIRVQMANAGMPLLGDHKYAGSEANQLSTRLGIKNVALCAYEMQFGHPKTRKKMEFTIIPDINVPHSAFIPFFTK